MRELMGADERLNIRGLYKRNPLTALVASTAATAAAASPEIL